MTEPFTISNAVTDSAYVDIPDTPETHLQYRFNGYQLPKIQLDSTGASTYVVPVHQYYYNQPEYWAKPYYESRQPVITKGQASEGFIENVPDNFETILTQKPISNGNLSKMLPFEP
jgi:hypothetical protein